MQPILSIVTPTRGNFSRAWLEQLLQVQGSVQFVLVYPPECSPQLPSDGRLKILASPFRGEGMQRFTGLLNADGYYLLALDDDDYVHPEVVQTVAAYFEQFPDSMVLRLKTERVDAGPLEQLQQPWSSLPAIASLRVVPRRPADSMDTLQEVPMAPLDIPFDRRFLIWPFTPRRDDHGPHIENFNTKVWRTAPVKAVLPEIFKAMELWGILTWIPRSGADRLLGLFVQARFYQAGQIIGHWMPNPPQVRLAARDPKLKPPRFHAASDWLLVRRYPQYGYFWNLFFNKLSYVPRIYAKLLLWRRQNKDPLDGALDS